jgi:hypothetical protein
MCHQLQASHARLVDEQQEKLKLEQELRHSERLASVGRLAAGLAHEIGTPLAIIGGRAEYLLRRSRSAAELKDNLGVIRSQSDRFFSPSICLRFWTTSSISWRTSSKRKISALQCRASAACRRLMPIPTCSNRYLLISFQTRFMP